MDENKKRALAAALSQIDKQFGKGSVMRMGARPDWHRACVKQVMQSTKPSSTRSESIGRR